MHPIDVHILHLPGENQKWREQCDASLVGHPINVHNIDGIVGNMRQARKNGFMAGTAPYVSFVDPDDFVEPNVFQVCLDELERFPNVCGVYTLSNKIFVDKDLNETHGGLLHAFQQWPIPKRGRLLEMHQIVVMRRDSVQYVYDHHFDEIPRMQHAETWMYWNMATRAPWRAINYVGYNWRIREDGAHNTLTQHDRDEAMRTAKYITDIRHSLPR